MLDTLQSSYRRRLLLAIADHTPRNEDEFTLTSFAPANGEPEQLEKKLQHVQLPKLADHGYIEWNSDTATIRRGPNFDEIAPLLRSLNNHEDELPDDWP